jgi:hypothetical protein
MDCGDINLRGVTDLSAADMPAAKTGSDNVRWNKSSRSTFNGNCVEVGFISNGNGVLARDTKSPGPTLQFTADAWSSFISQIKEEDI